MPDPDRSDVFFRAMGSDAHLVVVGGGPALLEAARTRVADLEARWSRFIDASEVSELNRRAGEAVPVSAETRLLVSRAVTAWWLTGGAFDPTVLGDVVRAGYDRSFEALQPGSAASLLQPGCDAIEIGADTVRLAPATGFDPGGIGKGLAADLVVAELLDAGAVGACVNLGGDVRVAGRPPAGDGWLVGVADPWAGDEVARVGLADGAVATSSVLRRRWCQDGRPRHHLIDPRTGAPSTSALVQVTAVAATGWESEVLAKAVLLNGDAHPFDILGGTGAEALAVAGDGAIVASSGLAAFTGPVSRRVRRCPSVPVALSMSTSTAPT
jgi:thiamine biosynthesis lipoprotein